MGQTAHPQKRHGHIDVVSLPAVDVGAGDGDPTVFLQGNPMASSVWRNVIPHVRGLGRVVNPSHDERG